MNTRRNRSEFRPCVDSLEDKTLLSALSIRPPRQAPVQVATNSNSNSNNNGGEIAPLKIYIDKFKLNGTKTSYTLKFSSGQYKFYQNYDMKIERVGHPTGSGLNAVYAMGVFLDRVAYQIDNYLYPTEVGAAQVENGLDCVIENEQFSVKSGKTSYELTIVSDGYRFHQEWYLKFNRVHKNASHGLTALQAIDVFALKLVANVERVILHRPVPIQPLPA